MNQLVAVYGSLRHGFNNHSLLRDQEFIGQTVTKEPYSMYSLGSYPYIDLRTEVAMTPIVVEVYNVTPTCMKRLDQLEGYPRFYNRTQVELATGDKAWIYHIESLAYRQAAPVVESGDWKLFKETKK